MEFDRKRMLKLSGLADQQNNDLLAESSSRSKDFDDTSLAEAKIRKAIRAEIASIVKEMREKSDSDWMFQGQKKPRSQTGKITLGMLGLGFGDKS